MSQYFPLFPEPKQHMAITKQTKRKQTTPLQRGIGAGVKVLKKKRKTQRPPPHSTFRESSEFQATQI